MTSGRPFDLVIFDLDGTLADTLPDITAALNATLAEAQLPPLPAETVVKYVGDGSAKLIERALPPEQAGRDLAPLLARFLAHYEAHPCVDSHLYPGVAEMLDTLAEAKIGAAVLTNKLGTVARRLLDALLPGHPFVAIVGDGDGFPRKPDPAAALALMARVGATPARTAVVGDGLPDVRMGRALAATAIAAAWGYVPREQLVGESPTGIAASPTEALRLLVGA
ncbi:MAG TPA: HAD hydrolase-like protein [Polyangia bacterium]|jgi:phosphoglycolate phosphatase